MVDSNDRLGGPWSQADGPLQPVRSFNFHNGTGVRMPGLCLDVGRSLGVDVPGMPGSAGIKGDRK